MQHANVKDHGLSNKFEYLPSPNLDRYLVTKSA